MSTRTSAAGSDRAASRELEVSLGLGAARYAVPIGRAAFALLFIIAAFGHFSERTIGYAAQAGVPLASLAVPASGVLSFLGGLSVLLGYRAKVGAWLLILFLVPVSLTLHKFWGLDDAAAAELHRIMFLKNLSMLGGALLITYFGAGPFSLDARAARR